jgi:putative ATPase
LDDLPALLAAVGYDAVRFDLVVGRNALTQHPDRTRALRGMAALLRPGGAVSLAEAVPRHTPRLYELVNVSSLDAVAAEALRAAEEAIYADPDDPMTNWDADDLRRALEAAGLVDVTVEAVEMAREIPVTPELIARWFEPAASGRPSYGQRLGRCLDAAALADIRALFARELVGQTVPWRSVVAFVAGRREG